MGLWARFKKVWDWISHWFSSGEKRAAVSDPTIFGRSVLDRLSALEVTQFGTASSYSDHTSFEQTVLARLSALEIAKFGRATVEPDTTSFTVAVLARLTALEGSGSSVAPVLSAPTANASGPSTANLGVATDQGNGTLYWIVSTLNIAPTAVQLLAGQDHSGAAAAASGSQAVSVTGAQTAPASGLTSGTTYFAYFLQVNAGSLQSNIAASASFVPAALATPSLARSSAPGAAPLVLSVSDTDFVVGYYFELQVSNVLNDTTFLAGNIVQDLIFFMDGADWAALDEAIGLATPSGDYSTRIRAARDNDSGATTVIGKDPQGNNVSFPADVSPWSNVVSDTINVASAVWNSTTGVNKSQYLTISGTPGLIVTGTSGVGTNCGVRTTTSTTGKRHFEITYTTAVNNFGFGIDDGTTALGPAQFNLPSPGVVYRKDGNIYVNGTAVQTGLATMAQGDVGACEFDTTAGTVKFFKNGVQMGTTITGVSFSAYYGYCMTYFDDVLTGNFGENAFSMTPTSGFAGW